MSEMLKPCPHCGESKQLFPAYRMDKAGNCHGPYAIDCLGCGTDFTPREGMDVIAAQNIWRFTGGRRPHSDREDLVLALSIQRTVQAEARERDEPPEKLERWALICATANQHDEAERLRREAAKAAAKDEGEAA